jgi:coenzyme Q-binding protein COQ10
MPHFTTTRRVRHAAADMFDLVADIERYPEFVPLCRRLRVRTRGAGPDGTEILVADMDVAYKLVSESFTTRVTLDQSKLQILVQYIEGPFSHLDNRWSFRPIEDRSCEVVFFISYEFRNRMLGILMGSMFDIAFRRFTSAFEQRADEIYGDR